MFDKNYLIRKPITIGSIVYKVIFIPFQTYLVDNIAKWFILHYRVKYLNCCYFRMATIMNEASSLICIEGKTVTSASNTSFSRTINCIVIISVTISNATHPRTFCKRIPVKVLISSNPLCGVTSWILSSYLY